LKKNEIHSDLLFYQVRVLLSIEILGRYRVVTRYSPSSEAFSMGKATGEEIG